MIFKKFYLYLLFLLVYAGDVVAQSTIKGTVVDTTNATPLSNANIILLHQKDSTLYRFTRSSLKGDFRLSGLDTGAYVIMMTYPKYVSFSDQIIVNNDTDLGQFILTPVEHLLNEVVVKGRRAVTIKGDTTEFDAGSFVVNANDRVEDLLKQLPGIQVDKDGKITAQGKAVSKVLVDGEEFFGDDPTLVTKNVRADMVDKVQLYDKSSDQAAFTGIDDGNKAKTINIKLKEDKKQGYFGKIAAGFGMPNQYYEANGAINYFKGKKKMAAYGTQSNDGVTAFGFRDAEKYGASNGSTSIGDDGGIYITSNNSDIFQAGFDGQFSGKGIPTTLNGGGMYQDKWNADKNSINTSVRTGNLNVVGNEQNYSQNNLQTGVLLSSGNSNFENKASQTSARAIFESKLDSLNTLKITLGGATRYGNQSSVAQNETRRANDLLVNTSLVKNSNSGTNNNMSLNLLWNKKFKKNRRTISLNLVPEISEENTSGFLYSQNDFYGNDGEMNAQNLIDQRKTDIVKNQSLNMNLSYTEPLSKNLSLILSYIGNVSSGLQDKRSFNKDASGDYSVQDDLYSSIFELKQYANQGGVNFNFNKEKLEIQWGSKVGAVRLYQYNQLIDNSFARTFLNVAPSFRVRYKKSQSSSLHFSYNGSTQQPNINQINPVQINNDPLNIRVGNPNLRPSFSNSVSMSYNNFKMLSDSYTYINIWANNTIHPIVNNISTDFATGKSIYTADNISNSPINLNLYSGMSNKIKKIDINYSYGFNGSYSTNYNKVNGVLNTTTSKSLGVTLGVSKYKKDKYDFYIKWNPSYSFVDASLQPQLNNNNFSYSIYSGFNLNLPKEFKIGGHLNTNYLGKSVAFAQPFSRTIFSPELSKTFFKEKNLMVSCTIHDLFNQNIGFNRSTTANQIYQNQYNTIRRFYMFKISWDFNKVGGK